MKVKVLLTTATNKLLTLVVRVDTYQQVRGHVTGTSVQCSVLVLSYLVAQSVLHLVTVVPCFLNSNNQQLKINTNKTMSCSL